MGWFTRKIKLSDDTQANVGAGLENLVNTCFLNSVLQCLTHTPPLVNSLNTILHETPCTHTEFCTLCALKQHINKALSSSGSVIAPYQLVENLSNISSLFNKYQQEDAHEFLLALLQSLHKNAICSNEIKACSNIVGASFVKRIFQGILKQHLRCGSCPYSSQHFEPMYNLSLHVNNADSVIQALESLTEIENIPFTCEKCKSKFAFKGHIIYKPPQVLIIQLNRFVDKVTKDQKEVSYPLVLNLKPYITTENVKGDFNYGLYGVIVHSGYSMEFGHYYSYVQTSRNVWHLFNDEHVRRVDVEYVLRQQAYILFYVGKGDDWFEGGRKRRKSLLDVVGFAICQRNRSRKSY